MRGAATWPLPALAAWLACWAVFLAAAAVGIVAGLAAAGAAVVGVACAALARSRWRRVVVAAGFPLSFAIVRAEPLPPWSWVAALVALALVYPPSTWSDAPLFPTWRRALRGLGNAVPLAPDAAILDAGSGSGAALVELRREYPYARLVGIERSWPLWLASALRCRFACVRRGDFWSADWRPYALVYVFQRPESMPRALAKAAHELRPGAWLASLEFEVAALVPQGVLDGDDGRRVWLYRAPFRSRA
ncbi:MAG: class I SAM-dependent methyltransferase [Rhizobacter sp.]|nr:class I SAM-dependent methyltransferase [Rhizobacter sp.]